MSRKAETHFQGKEGKKRVGSVDLSESLSLTRIGAQLESFMGESAQDSAIF